MKGYKRVSASINNAKSNDCNKCCISKHTPHVYNPQFQDYTKEGVVTAADIEKDAVPENLPPITADFAEDKEVCKNYQEAKDVFMGT